MAITIDWDTRVINIPQTDLTFVGGVLYELDVDAFRLTLRDLEDSEEGMAFPTTHRHNTQVTLAGVTFARTVEIINGYTVQFEDGQYTVRCVGANHNVADVKVANQVSLIIGNSAGLIVTAGGGAGASAAEVWQYGNRSLTDKAGFGLSASYDAAKDAASQAALAVVDGKVDGAQATLDDLHDEAFGEWELNFGTNQLILKRKDGTALWTFNLTETSVQKIFSRRVPS